MSEEVISGISICFLFSHFEVHQIVLLCTSDYKSDSISREGQSWAPICYFTNLKNLPPEAASGVWLLGPKIPVGVAQGILSTRQTGVTCLMGVVSMCSSSDEQLLFSLDLCVGLAADND